MKSLKIPKVLIRICKSKTDNTMSNINTIDTQHTCFPSSLGNSHIRLLPLIQEFLIFILCFKLFLINKIDTQHPCFPSSLRNSHIRLLPLIQGFLIFILCFKLFLNIRKNLCIFGDRIYFDSIIHVYFNCQTQSYTNLVFRRFNKAGHRQGSAFSKFAYLFIFLFSRR